MKHTAPKRMTIAQLEDLARRDHRRMIVMGVGVLVLGGAIIGASVLQNKYETQKQTQLTEPLPTPPLQSQLYLPPFQDEDRAVLLEIRDETQEEKLQIHEAAKRTLLTYALFLTPRHFDALGVRLLDAEGLDQVRMDPAGNRMKPFTTRGRVSSLGTFQSPQASFPEYRGLIDSEYGGSVRFVLAKDPAEDNLAKGSYVRLDGLFLQWARIETQEGWQDMPLLCGRELTPSMEVMVHDEERLNQLLAKVEDDIFDSGAEIADEAKWALLAKGLDENSGVNWEEALELDSDTLTSLFKNPEMYRGRAFRLPISVNMGLDDPVHGENPLRADVLSTGWVGNQTWIGPAPVIKWIAAMDGTHLMDRKGVAHYLIGRGFFLKNLDYENADGRPLRAPVFAMQSMKIFTPVVDGRPEKIMYVVTGTTGLMIILFFGLLMRDKRDSRRLQEEMVRRRRARRNRTQATTDPTT